MKSNFIKSKIFILTENADGELYSIETDEYNDIVNDWYGDCKLNLLFLKSNSSYYV